MSCKSLFCLKMIVALSVVNGVARADFTINAADNATIQPGGPRSGVNGKRFLNIEGSANGTFASYGVIDFTTTAMPTSSVTSLSLTLFQSNAAFSVNGGLRFYLSQDTTTSIQSGTSPLTFMPGASNDGIGNGLGALTLLGAGTYTQVTNGTADVFTFAVPLAAQGYLGQQANNGGTIRLVIAATDPTTAATYGGGDNFSGAPTLTATTVGNAAVPEPSSLVLAGIGSIVVAGAVRFRERRIA